MGIKLAIPPRSDTVQPGVELRAVYVEEWVESLPHANPAALQKHLIEAISAFNRSPVKPGLRFQLLELYLKPYQFLLEYHQDTTPVSSATVLEKRRAASDGARLLSMELASGYKIVLSDAGSKRGLFGPMKEKRLALQRAVLFLSFALLHSYDEYLPTPSRLWLELYALDAYARSRSLAENPGAGSRELRPEFSESIDHTFKRIVLTSLVDPFHLAHGDVWRVYRAFADCAQRAEIRAVEPVTRPAGIFVLNPKTDHRPVGYAEIDGDLPRRTRLLDVNPVLEVLRERLPAGAARLGGSDGPLLGAMIRALSLPPRRHTPRERSEGQVSLATGLSAVHHFIGGESLSEMPEVSDAQTADGIVLEAEELDTTLTGRNTYRSEHWELVNQGPGGIGLVKRARPNTAIGVGEIICVQLPQRAGDGSRWSVGVIRWLSIGDNGDYQAGVQILGRDADPLAIEVSRPDGSSRLAAAVAVPSLTATRGAAIIAPSGVTDGTTPLRARAADGATLVLEPDEILETAPGFERFSYRHRAR